MFRKSRIAISAIAFLALLSGCPTITSGQKSLAFDSAQNVYCHEASGFSFPAAVGHFQRHDTSFYDESGNNFSVNYALITPQEKVVASIYIYPSLRDYSVFPIPALGQTPEWFLNEQYEGAKDAIIKRYSARIVSEGDHRLSRSLLNPTGKKGVFEWDTVSGETVLSHLYLFTHKGWLVKYRFTYPSKYNSVIEHEIANFIESYEWP